MEEISEFRAYEDLINAIIERAADDWRAANKRLRKYPYDEKALIRKDECERFFKGDWIKEISDIDGNYILEQLQKEEYDAR